MDLHRRREAATNIAAAGLLAVGAAVGLAAAAAADPAPPGPLPAPRRSPAPTPPPPDPVPVPADPAAPPPRPVPRSQGSARRWGLPDLGCWLRPGKIHSLARSAHLRLLASTEQPFWARMPFPRHRVRIRA